MTSLEEAFLSLEMDASNQNENSQESVHLVQSVPSSFFVGKFYSKRNLKSIEKEPRRIDQIKAVILHRFYKYKMDKKPIWNALFCLISTIILSLLVKIMRFDIVNLISNEIINFSKRDFYLSYFSPFSFLLQIPLELLTKDRVKNIR